jgi:uncharacterized protein
MRRSFVRAVLMVLVSGPLSAQSAQPPGMDQAVTFPAARQYDLTSKMNGLVYRLLISAPETVDPATKLPVLYVLDANYLFTIAAQTAIADAIMGLTKPAIVVGIAYPGTDVQEIVTRRSFELTPSLSTDRTVKFKTGGSATFLRVLEEEIKPFVSARYSVDSSNQALWGHSLGGLTALNAMFSNPTAFSTYLISSPSIWWNDREVLQKGDHFQSRAQTGELKLRVLIMSAAEEQYRGPDPKRLAADNRMVDNASELATQLSRLHTNVAITRVIFDGENHNSVIPASLSRGIRFAFPR